MPALSLSPALNLLAQFTRFQPSLPIRTFIRTAGYKLRPPRPLPFSPTIRRAQEAIFERGLAMPRQKSNVLHEQRKGSVPTIVLGGFVPDALDQVFMLRGHLLKFGSLYYINYSRNGFSTDLFCAQLDDLIEELALLHDRPPVLFTVSFGCGLVLEWLRRARRNGRTPVLGGIVLISPVACVEDLLEPGAPKPTTLLGRAVKPFVDAVGPVSEAAIQKSRITFTKMFEAGAQNKDLLYALMSKGELERLKTSALGAIQNLDAAGATERVQALKEMPAPAGYFNPDALPLSDAPTLILYAEKEASVITSKSPTRFALEQAPRAYFPNSTVRLITNPRGSPVQHASLIFHVFNFLPPIQIFYRQVRKSKVPLAAV
jgi:pimeloyl-ACP methyl ester carboxylesterase